MNRFAIIFLFFTTIAFGQSYPSSKFNSVTINPGSTVCNGTTNDSAALASALLNGPITIGGASTVCNAASTALGQIAGVINGPGRVKTSDGNFRAPLTSGLTSAPSIYGNWDNPGTAFNGNLSGVGIAHQHTVTGAATASQPSSGYVIHPETSAEVLNIYSTSGWNQSLSGNGGRTGILGKYYDVSQYGQGDLTGIGCFGIVASTLAGATNYLASPAVECLGGELFGGADGSYIEYLGDMDINDNGYDIAAAGIVMNFLRSNATENISANWVGEILTSNGSMPTDELLRLTGPTTVGIDMSAMNVQYSRLASVTVNSGGTGYAVGDLLTVTGGTSITPTVFQVATLGASNSIATISVVNTGIYTVAPVSAYTALTFTGGTGSAANIAGQYIGNTAITLPKGGCIVESFNSGSPTANLVGVYNSVCMNDGYIKIGGPNNTSNNNPGGRNIEIGDSNNALGNRGTLLGSYVYDVAQNNGLYFSSGTFPGFGNGRSQISTFIFRNLTQSTVRLTSDSLTATSQNTYILLAGTAHSVEFVCTAIDSSNPNNTSSWKRKSGFANRTASGNSTYTGDATSPITPDYSTGNGNTATIQLTADTTFQSLNFTFTVPTGSTTDYWHAQCTLYSDQIQ